MQPVPTPFPAETTRPGPKDHPLIGSLPELRRGVIGLMTRSFADHGDLVRFKLGPLTIHLASHPDEVKQILKQPLAFDKKTRTSDMIRQITGESVLINNGEAWERHRRLLQPAFAPLELKSFFSLFAKATDDLIAQLATIAGHETTATALTWLWHASCKIQKRKRKLCVNCQTAR